MSLDIWLSTGEEVSVGGKNLIMRPLPLSKLRKISAWLREAATEEVMGVIREQKKDANPFRMAASLMSKINMTDLCMELFATPKDLEGELVNPGLTREFFEEHVDLPTARRVIGTFIKVNELEETLKNLQSLPVVRQIMEALTLTFGQPFLSSLQRSTDLLPGRSAGSPSPRSTDTLRDAVSETLENGPEKPQVIQ